MNVGAPADRISLGSLQYLHARRPEQGAVASLSEDLGDSRPVLEIPLAVGEGEPVTEVDGEDKAPETSIGNEESSTE